MHRTELTKSDGRKLYLYSTEPLENTPAAPTPKRDFPEPNPHLRWHALRGEWVSYAAYRQNRVFLPPPEYNPLGITRSPDAPTELPPGNYQVAVFENLSPALCRGSHSPPPAIVPTREASGSCEVVVFSQDPTTSLARLPLWHLELILEVWADRTRELAKRDDIAYVMPFENRGVEVGVTLHHPHGQLYAYPFVPPVPARMLEEQRKFWEKEKRGLLEDVMTRERQAGTRVLYEDTHALSWVPVFARYPYETWIAPRRAVPTLADLDADERRALARALKTTLMKFDGLWNRPFPYLMAIHQAPTDGQPHPEAHLHFEFYPPYRSEKRLKYLAGTELGAGMFANDSLPEEKAAELQAVEVSLE